MALKTSTLFKEIILIPVKLQEIMVKFLQ